MIKDIVSFVCLICAQDGIISETEINSLKEQLKKHQKKLDIKNPSEKEFERLVEDFFNSKKDIDDYFKLLHSSIETELLLHIALVSATSDGLDIRENIAFDRALKISKKNLDDIEKWEE
tara:strand:+ start:764 stop:1120 length:357 start_codon:yes stop_codon:yes gene_type:complete